MLRHLPLRSSLASRRAGFGEVATRAYWLQDTSPEVLDGRSTGERSGWGTPGE